MAGLRPLSTVTRVEPSSGPEFTMRFNLYRAAQVNATAAARLQLARRDERA